MPRTSRWHLLPPKSERYQAWRGALCRALFGLVTKDKTRLVHDVTFQNSIESLCLHFELVYHRFVANRHG